ncbi:MAG: LamG domain-containing protein [Limisphaerales bacterium]
MNAKLGKVRREFVTSVLAMVCLWTASSAIADALYPPTNSYSCPWLDRWSFSNTNTWQTDLGYSPLSYTNLGVSFIGDGTAVVVDDSTNAAWLQYNVWEENGTTNLTVDVGSVMLWFAPDWASQSQGGTGPADWGPLIETGAFTTNAAYGWWSLYLDRPGSNILFSAQDGLGDQTNYLSAPISWNSNQFHFVALTYSSTNTALYIDGSLVTNGPGVTIYPSLEVLSNGFWLGSDSTGSNQCHGILDDISTYNYPLDADTISSAFVLYEIFYLPNMAIAASIAQAPFSPETTPIFDAVTGPGYLLAISTNTSGWVSSSNVWITNTTATVTTNGVNLAFSIGGGSNGLAYDVFATPALTQPLTTGIWTWMGQGQPAVSYCIPGLTNGAVFLLLGTPQNSYTNGLTDAYELLVLHQNPANGSQSGDGMLDGWKVLWGMNPLINNSAVPSQRANYTYDGTGRLETLSGTNAEIFNFDAEGSITNDQP